VAVATSNGRICTVVAMLLTEALIVAPLRAVAECVMCSGSSNEQRQDLYNSGYAAD